MTPHRPSRLLLLAVVAALGLAACAVEPGDSFSGYVEGDLVFIGPTEPGRVSALVVEEGRVVKPGDVVARVEDDLQAADRDGAAAQLKEAEARLANARSPLQRPEEIAVLQASEQRAAAALDQSRVDLDRQKALVPKGASSQANLDAAQHQYDQNQAALDEARKRISAARIASRTQDIEAAEQAVSAARANLVAAQVRLDRRTLKAPTDGTVQTVYYRVGELVPEGRPVVSILPPGLVKVRFFVPEPLLPKVALGASVTVTCDGCPTTTAKIFFISAEAEYTPPVIYSREERSKLVYLVEARPDDPAKARPGQPVSVSLGAAP
ncbi:HlyD family secretion protein [Xanthobacter autotrophicus]|uniref:HlyD family secretion protein n=1 Tax=Xanthobacter autotrophicus TaxID=280 RepID=UPI0024A63D81|nr:HlyD family efflux transporter periplasmic adaptor subunit [Xanthobacter autotrophicus]MDI4657478.1 HlyD family efflux transporter periplasmic adaptor subunit [Xanthobacter autotrophicus]